MILTILNLKNVNCRTGIILNIGNLITFEHGIIPNQWLNASVQIIDLEMGMERTRYIEPGAFNSESFSETISLVLTNFNASSGHNEVLQGLKNVRTLKMYDLHSTEFANGWLTGVSNYLQTLLVFGMPFKSYDISGFTSGVNMTSLTFVTFSLNLSNTINEYTFSGLVAVRVLELSFCSIETIGPRSFDRIALTLRDLKLNNNHLKQLPQGMFNVLLPDVYIRIYLSENPFDCSCALSDLRQKLLSNIPNFVQIPKCFTPFNLYNTPVHLVDDICWNESDPNRFNTFVKCYNEKNVSSTQGPIQSRKHLSRIVQHKNNSVLVEHIQSSPQSLTLVITKVNNLNRTADCLFCEPLQPFHWTTLQMMHLYLICVMDPLKVRASIFDAYFCV